jgi:RHS repeat-associated protein
MPAFGSRIWNVRNVLISLTSNVTQTITPTGGTSLQYYDADGNVTESIAADNGSIVYTYDHDDRQTQQLWYASSTLVNTLNKTYDNDGDLLTASNGNGTYTFAYDHDNRLTNVQEPFSASLSYAYDGDGNQTQVVDSFGGTQTSVYDVQDRLVTREYTGESNNLRVDFTYGANGQVATETRYDSLLGPAYGTSADLVATATDSYDGNGNVAEIQNTQVSTTIDQFVYTYDRAGNLSSETDTQQGTATTTTYSYDAANQLTGSGGASYSYDANGNRDSTGYTTGTGNELTSDGTYNYTYDAKGNEITKTNISTSWKWTYGYNNANEMTSAVETNASSVVQLSVAYKYDVFGNLIEEDVTVGATTTATKFAQDGWNSNMAAATGLSNFNNWAVLNSNNTLQTRNVFGNQVDQVLGRVDQTGASDASGQYWDLTDHLGSVRDVVNSSGTVKDSIAYDAYGNIVGTELNSSYRGMYAWTGRQLDVETGLQYNRARWYDSLTGRWISQDPMGFDAGDSNLYRYVKNQAIDATDPSGEIVIFVHGVNDEGNWFRKMYNQMSANWLANGQDQQLGFQFVWQGIAANKPFVGNATSTIAGTLANPVDSKAVNRLKAFADAISSLPSLQNRSEQIDFVAHSEGTMVVLAALSKGMAADQLVMLNSPLSIRQNALPPGDLWSAFRNLRGDASFYWSPDDAAVRLINGSARPVQGPNMRIQLNPGDIGGQFYQYQITGSHGASDAAKWVPFYAANVAQAKGNNSLSTDPIAIAAIRNLLKKFSYVGMFPVP